MKKIFYLCLLQLTFATAFSQTGFRVKLIKNLDPHPQGQGTAYCALWGYTSPNGREYAILGCVNGTSFIDITDTNNVTEVDYLTLPGGVSGSIFREMKTYSHYCYIVSESPGSKIQIVDLQYLPDSIRYVGLSNVPSHSTTHTISQSGPYLYLNGGNKYGIAVLDLSVNPESPILRDIWADMYVHDSRIINDTIWACNISDGKVSIIDARNKDSLRTIRNWTNSPAPNSPHNIALSGNGNYAFVTDEVFGPPGRLKVWDISDFENITYLTSFIPYQFENAVVHNVELYQNFAFLAYYAAGVKVLNISNPSNPVEIGWYDTYPENNGSFGGCWAVYYFPTGKIIASDVKRGLFVLRPDLSTPVAGFPRAEFTVAQPDVSRFQPQTFIDMTEGIPANWLWTITGPQNQTSTMQNPVLPFLYIGDYNVKLKVSNSFGTDSIVKSNVFRVLNASLPSFQTVNPPGPSFRILTSPGDTNKVIFDWKKSVNSQEIFYKIYFKKVSGTTEEYILSGNSGRDTSILLSKSYLDSMALRFGTEGDSVRIFYRARTYYKSDSATSSNSVILTFRRNSTGIYTLNELIPSEYKLYNNYPNPFNPETNIKFDVPKAGYVNITLYDISGKEILKLLNENLSAGSYGLKMYAGNLASGIYFLKLYARDYAATIRTMLIK